MTATESVSGANWSELTTEELREVSERVNRGAVAPNDWALFRGLVDELIRALEEKQGQMGSGAEGAESIEIDFGVQEKVSAGSSRSSGTENGT